jgi:hypothetical protein
VAQTVQGKMIMKSIPVNQVILRSDKSIYEVQVEWYNQN